MWKEFDIQTLPYFDPQLQFGEGLPETVADFRSQAQKSDYIFISTPEYAHGIPGILKNALEWLICEETMRKKVAIFIGAPSGGQFVKEYLLETLKTMDLIATPEKTLVVRNARNNISNSGEISNAELRSALEKFLRTLLL